MYRQAIVTILVFALLAQGAPMAWAAPAPAVRASGHSVTLTASGFDPTALTVTVGDMVTWVNTSGQNHTLATGTGDQAGLYLPLVVNHRVARDTSPARAAAESFSGPLPANGRIMHTFATPGEYPYHLAGSPEVNGLIIVQPRGDLPTPPATPPPSATPPTTTTLPPPTPLPENKSPTLNPIGDRTAALGSRLDFTLTGSDPDGDALTFSATRLPANASLNGVTGAFSFRPAADQVGDFEITFFAGDGRGGVDNETMTINVPTPEPEAPTAVSGQLLTTGSAANDGAAYAASGETPIFGAIIHAFNTLTDPNKVSPIASATAGEDGQFYLDISLEFLPPPGHFQIWLDGTTAQGGSFADIQLQLEYLPNPNTNTILDVTFLPQIGDATIVQVNQPAQLTADGVILDITANTAPAGTQLALSVFPRGGDLSQQRLDEFFFTTTGASDLEIGHPGAKVTLPNRDNLPNGAVVDIYLVEPQTGPVKVAEAVVSGHEIVIPGGERGLPRSGRYFAQVRPPAIENSGGPYNSSREKCCKIIIAPGTSADVHTGNLSIVHALPGHRSREQTFAPTLVYNSQAASGQTGLSFDLTIPGNAPPNSVALTLVVNGIAQGTYHVDTSQLSGNTFHVNLPVDGSNLTTGRYGYQLIATAFYRESTTTSSFSDDVFINNQASSPFGAGVTLAELARLHPQDNGDVIFTGGDGSTRLSERIPETPCLDDTNEPSVLARFDLNDNTFDGSGNSRHAAFLGGSFEATPLGRGLRVGPGRPAGLDWSDSAHLLRPPYTIEMILTADQVNNFQKLFGFDDANTWGWYLRSGGFRAFPHFPALGEGVIQPGKTHYLAVVATAFDQVAVYIDGINVGNVRNPVPVPPPGAIFFQDDAPSGGSEQFNGVIDCLRISNIARSPQEIARLQRLLAARLNGAQPGDYLSPPGDYGTLSRNLDGSYTLTSKHGGQRRFDAAGRQTAVTGRNSNTTTYNYTDNRLAQITDPTGFNTSFQDMNNDGLIDAISDDADRTTSLAHDGNLLTNITNADGSNFGLFYDGNSQPYYTVNERGAVTQFDFNEAGQFTGAVRSDLSSVTLVAVEGVGLVTAANTAENPASPVHPNDVFAAFSDGNGNEFTFSTNELFDSVVAATDPLDHTTQVLRDENNNIVGTMYPNGRVDTAAFDENGNPTQAIFAAGSPLAQPFTFTYGSFNLLTGMENPVGDNWTFDRDEWGNLIVATDSLGGQATAVYNEQGLPTSVINQNGQTTSFTYNSRFNVETIILPGGELGIEYVYDAAGNPITVINSVIGDSQTAAEGRAPAQSRTTIYTYDAMNHLTSATDPTGAATRFRYDAAGNLTEVELPTGEVARYEYDGLNRLAAVDDPVRGRSQYVYDGNGNVTQAYDALGYATHYEYDGRNRLTRTLDPLGNETLFTYDAMGNLTLLQDARGQTTTFNYDLLDRVTLRRNPLGQETTYTYDSRNNLAARANPNGQTLAYSYDALSRLTGVQTPDNTLAFGYDAVGNRLSAEDDDSRVVFTYDARNRLLTAVTEDHGHQPAVTLNYSYNAFGERTGLADSLGGVTGYLYDDAGRLTRLTTPAGDAIHLAYDPTGRLLETLFPNGLATQLEYDAQGRLATLRHGDGGGEDLLGFSYGYNELGNIIAIDETRPGVSEAYRFGFDPLQRLVTGGTEALPEVYVYDANGNRAVSHLADMHDNDDANRLLEDENFTYSYDANGNLVAKTDKAGGGVTAYSYDAQNQLVRIDFAGGGIVTYRYDALGRRIEKNVDGTITRYVYDGLDLLLEFDGGNSLATRYSHGPGIDNPLSLERDGQRYFYHSDHLGSVRLLSDSSGAVANRYAYDGYGRLLNLAETVPNPFTYTGREFDAESGLYYYRLRYYDPQSGRFVSQDPLGFGAGDVNLYRYVGNNPLNRVDPLGLLPAYIGVDLTTNVATIGVLTALLLPAVQGGREAARRAPSANNLSQLGLATHNDVDVTKVFPAPPPIMPSTARLSAQSDRARLIAYQELNTSSLSAQLDLADFFVTLVTGKSLYVHTILADDIGDAGESAEPAPLTEGQLYGLHNSLYLYPPRTNETPPVELGNGDCIL